MSTPTKIEWVVALANDRNATPSSWNPIRARNRVTGKVGWFCVHASEGCRNCYAEELNVNRFGNGIAFKAQNLDKVEIYLDDKMLAKPKSWRTSHVVFVADMFDLFADFIDTDMIDQLFDVMEATPQHLYILLTKRPAIMEAYTVHRYRLNSRKPPKNIWFGTSVEDQPSANGRIPQLLDIQDAAMLLISYEPALSAIDFTDIRIVIKGVSMRLNALTGETFWWNDGFVKRLKLGPTTNTIGWIITGDESGPNARPADHDWYWDLIKPCHTHGTPLYIKQMVINGKMVKNPPLHPELKIQFQQIPTIPHNEDTLLC